MVTARVAVVPHDSELIFGTFLVALASWRAARCAVAIADRVVAIPLAGMRGHRGQSQRATSCIAQKASFAWDIPIATRWGSLDIDAALLIWFAWMALAIVGVRIQFHLAQGELRLRPTTGSDGFVLSADRLPARSARSSSAYLASLCMPPFHPRTCSHYSPLWLTHIRACFVLAVGRRARVAGACLQCYARMHVGRLQ